MHIINGNHWTLGLINFKGRTVEYRDWMGAGGKQYAEMLLQWLADETRSKTDKELDRGAWTLEPTNVDTTPQQENW